MGKPIMVVQEQITYRASDLWVISQQPEYAAQRLELSEGRLIVMSPSSAVHGKLTALLAWILVGFNEQHKLGLITGAKTGFILYRDPDPAGRDTVRAPDVAFVASARVPAPLPDGFVPFAPDLAVEVISPNENANDIHEKVTEYLRYGTRAVWLFFPKTKTAAIYTANSFTPVPADGTLDGGEVLPGFTLPLARLYE